MHPVPIARPTSSPELEESLVQVLRSGWWGYGPKCAELESVWTTRFGGWALATSSCTSALYLAAKLIEPQPGDNVLVPAITYASTAASFLSAGMLVHCVDVRPDSLLVDPGSVIAAVTPRTRAVVAVHLYGQRAETEALRECCDRRGIYLIEDCAHRVFPWNETPVGHVVCFSFNAVKELPAGEGGLIWSSDLSMQDRARTLSNVGLQIDTPTRIRSLVHQDQHFSTFSGLKLRLNDLAASLVLNQIPHLDRGRQRRRQIVAAYEASFKRHATDVTLIPRTTSDSFLMFVARIRSHLRDSFRSQLADHGVSTSIHYTSLAHNPLVSGGESTLIANACESEIFTLPCFAGMSDHDVERVCCAIEASLKRSQRSAEVPLLTKQSGQDA